MVLNTTNMTKGELAAWLEWAEIGYLSEIINEPVQTYLRTLEEYVRDGEVGR